MPLPDVTASGGLTAVKWVFTLENSGFRLSQETSECFRETTNSSCRAHMTVELPPKRSRPWRFGESLPDGGEAVLTRVRRRAREPPRRGWHAICLVLAEGTGEPPCPPRGRGCCEGHIIPACVFADRGEVCVTGHTSRLDSCFGPSGKVHRETRGQWPP